MKNFHYKHYFCFLRRSLAALQHFCLSSSLRYHHGSHRSGIPEQKEGGSAGPSPKISLTMGCLGEGWGREVDSAEVLSPQVKSQLRQYEFVKFSLSLAILQCSGWCKLSHWYCGRPIAIISKLFQRSRDVQGDDVQGDWPSIKMYCMELPFYLPFLCVGE